MLAVRLLAEIAALAILCTSDGLQMIRVHAKRRAAKVIQVKPGGDRTFVDFIEKTVRAVLPIT